MRNSEPKDIRYMAGDLCAQTQIRGVRGAHYPIVGVTYYPLPIWSLNTLTTCQVDPEINRLQVRVHYDAN